jgi:hypothetical protein
MSGWVTHSPLMLDLEVNKLLIVDRGNSAICPRGGVATPDHDGLQVTSFFLSGVRCCDLGCLF